MTNPANLYETNLRVSRPSFTVAVVVRTDLHEVHVDLAREEEAATVCPKCRRPAPRNDTYRHRWKRMDMAQFKAPRSVGIRRVNYREQGVLQICVPLAESGSRCTELFESLVADSLIEVPRTRRAQLASGATGRRASIVGTPNYENPPVSVSPVLRNTTLCG
jgi:hypothetical protein